MMRVCCGVGRKRFLDFSALLVIGLAMTLPGWLGAAERSGEQAKPFRYEPGDHRDPFIALVREGRVVVETMGMRSDTSLILHGVLWDPGGHSIALIGDAEVKVGEMVDGYRVMEIRQDAVVLSDGGEPRVLQITFDAPPTATAPGATTGGQQP